MLPLGGVVLGAILLEGGVPRAVILPEGDGDGLPLPVILPKEGVPPAGR